MQVSDAKLRVAMRGELSRLHQRYGITTLYVTHDQVEATTLGHRIAVFDRGRLQQVGTPQEVYQTPRNVFVAAFIGSPAMNLARTELARGPDGLTLIMGEHRWPIPEHLLARRPTLLKYIGRELVVGVRPGDLAVAAADSVQPRLRCQAATVEYLGGARNLLFAPPGPAPVPAGNEEADVLWTARLRATVPVRTGEEITLAVNLAHAHFFDPATTEAIPLVDETAMVAAGTP